MSPESEDFVHRLSRLARTAVLGWLAVAALIYLIFLPGIRADLAMVGVSLSELFTVAMTNPAAEGVYLESLVNELKPWKAVRIFWLNNPLIYLLPLAFLGWYWRKVMDLGQRFARSLWPAALPAIFGVALLPIHLRGFASGYVVLDEQGLTHPGAVAYALGEVTATPILGAIVSAVSLALMAWSQSRWPRHGAVSA